MKRDGSGWAAALRRPLSLLHDTALRARLRHIGHLLSGNVTTMVLGLASIAIVGRALGPASYGTLALTMSFATAIEGMVSFQTWQPMIRYGATLVNEDKKDDLRQLLKFGLLLDIGASTAAWLIAISLACAGGWIFGWDATTLHDVLLYATVLLFGLTGMPTAVLRISGKFRTVAYCQVFGAVVRLLACAITFAAGGGLTAFVLVFVCTQILSALTLLTVALYALHRQGVGNLLTAPLTGVTRRFPGLWRFTWSANLSLTLWSAPQQFDTLLVGALTSPTEAGFYHIAKRIGRASQQMGAQVQAVVYPELSRLWNSGAFAEFRLAVYQVELMMACAGTLAVAAAAFLAYPVIRLALGNEFIAAAPLLIVQIAAVAMALCGSVTRSALLSMGQQHLILRTVVASTSVFTLTALTLIPMIGAMGANFAHVALGLTWLTGLLFAFRSALKRNGDDSAVASEPL